jgi:hypothetical protein
MPQPTRKPTQPCFFISRADLCKLKKFAGERRSTRQAVWIELANIRNRCGKTTFTANQDHLVNETGLSVRTVRYCLKDLAAIRMLRVEIKRTSTGHYEQMRVTMFSDIPPRGTGKPTATIAHGEPKKESPPSANDDRIHLPHFREVPEGDNLKRTTAEAAGGLGADAPAAPLGVDGGEKKAATTGRAGFFAGCP